MRETPVGEPHALQSSQVVGVDGVERAFFERELEVDDLLDLRQEPAVDLRQRVQLFDAHADAERVGNVPDALGARIGELVGDRVRVDRLQVEAVDADLEAAQRLLQ